MFKPLFYLKWGSLYLRNGVQCTKMSWDSLLPSWQVTEYINIFECIRSKSWQYSICLWLFLVLVNKRVIVNMAALYEIFKLDNARILIAILGEYPFIYIQLYIIGLWIANAINCMLHILRSFKNMYRNIQNGCALLCVYMSVPEFKDWKRKQLHHITSLDLQRNVSPYIVYSMEISVSNKLLKPPLFFSGLISSVIK